MKLLILWVSCIFVLGMVSLSDAGTVVVIETSMGTIKIELEEEKAPISSKNFLSYVNKGFFNGTIFHRVIGNFMIQGGGFDESLKEKATQPAIKNEAGNGLKNTRGTVAMARTPVVDSATSQFFINVKDNSSLDHRSEDAGGFGYAVFGRVIDGMDVVEKIKKVKTTTKGFLTDIPVENVVIKKVSVAK